MVVREIERPVLLSARAICLEYGEVGAQQIANEPRQGDRRRYFWEVSYQNV